MDHDVVVVGGGHNGLICAAYLARAGLDVLVLEARDTVGGCSSTVDALDARINICNCDHVTIRSTPIVEELNLADHGLEYFDLEPHTLSLGWDGRSPWFGFHDIERTIESIAVSYSDQVDGYRRYLEHAMPVAELLLAVTQTIPTPRRIVRRVLGRRGRGLTTLLRWNRMSAEEVLRLFFTNEALLGPAVITGAAVRGVPPNAPGTGLGAVSYAIRHLIKTGRPRGGSGELPAAAAAVVVAAGGRVECGSRVEAIILEGGRVRGVRIAPDRVVEAPILVSAVDPRRTLLEWITDPPARAVSLIRRWQQRIPPAGYQSKLDAIVDRLPAYSAADLETSLRHGVPDPLVPTALVSPPLSGISAGHQLLGSGRVAAEPVFNVNFPSVPDPAVRPSGGHLLSLEVLFTPYDLAGGWTGSNEPQRWLSAYGNLVGPGFEDSVKRWRAVSPPDYESEFGLVGGYAPSFPGSPLSALLGGNRELTRYRTPIRGLYLTGAGTFPGSGVWGASGRNTARIVLQHS